MNKRFYRVLCLVMSIVMLLGTVGCGGTEDVWSEWIDTVEIKDENSSETDVTSSEEEVSSEDTVTSDIESTIDTPSSSTQSTTSTNDKKTVINITNKSRTKYKIVVSLSNEGYDEGRLMQKVIKATSNASVPLILDTENASGPEIIIGDTTRDLSQNVKKTLKPNEYAIKADSNGNIAIIGDNAYALTLAVEEFLVTYFGFDKNATKIGTGKEKAVPINLNIKKNLLSVYKLTWSDEFNGSKVDTNKWCFVPHMREQLHLKLFHDERAVKVENGHMNLISGRIDSQNYWTNTSLSTAETMVFKYGYLEMRAKVPFGAPAFPSFWMQSNGYDAAEPLCMAEIDMFEHFCSQGDDYLQTGVHKWYKDGTGDHYVGPQIGRYYFGSEKIAEQWHTYSLLWTEESMNFMVDGVTYHTIDITKTGDFGDHNDGMGAFHDYCHIIFNNYVHTSDGSEEGNKSEQNAKPTDKFPIKYIIDYVRLYQIPGQGGVVNLKEVK